MIIRANKNVDPGGQYRISAFDLNRARAAFGYLLDTGYRLLVFLGEEVRASERNPAWVRLANDAFRRWKDWHQREEARLKHP